MIIANVAAAHSGGGGLQLAWQPCGNGAECTSIEVPVDWNRPGGRKITLAFARHRASDPATRIGTLVFQPGQGVSAMQFVAARIGTGGFPANLIARFDIVGIDQRGGGANPSFVDLDLPVRSTALHCSMPAHEGGSRYFPTTPEEFEHLRDYNRVFALDCLERSGPVVKHMDSLSQAHDLEAVREALGEHQISWLSWTTASTVGTTYLSLYPRRVRAMVLDQPSDHSLAMKPYVRDHAAAVQDEFNRFAQWCANDRDCQLFGSDVHAALANLVEAKNAVPIPPRQLSNPLSGDELLMLGQDMLGIGDLQTFVCGSVAATGFHVLAVAIDLGDPKCLPGIPGFDGLFAFENTYRDSIGWPNAWEQYHAISCGDFDTGIDGYWEFSALVGQLARIAPDMRGVSPAWEVLSGCVGWPFRPGFPQQRLDFPRQANVMIVSSRHSEWAPYEHALRLQKQIRGSSLLTYEGDAHISYLSSRQCVRTWEQDYLVTLTAPAPGTTCPQEGPLAGKL